MPDLEIGVFWVPPLWGGGVKITIPHRDKIKSHNDTVSRCGTKSSHPI